MAISVGETAPLLYTAGFSDSLPTLHLTHAPIGYLTYAVWTFYNSPFKGQQDLSYDAALILVVLVLVLIVASRLIVRNVPEADCIAIGRQRAVTIGVIRQAGGTDLTHTGSLLWQGTEMARSGWHCGIQGTCAT